MKHADNDTLQRLAPLLEQVRAIEGLKEKRPGVFYRRSKAFLHFHDDPAGIYADVRLEGADFTRMRSTTPLEWKKLLHAIRGVGTGIK
jgi:hypothetical protein